MTSSEPSPTPAAAGATVPQCSAIDRSRPRKSPGTRSMRRPKKSLICVLAMSTAMPLVKPMTTGRGKYLTAVPSPVSPSRSSITPAISVHMKSPSRPWVCTMPATTTTNAPVGPPIWTREPPRAETRNPATMAQ